MPTISMPTDEGGSFYVLAKGASLVITDTGTLTSDDPNGPAVFANGNNPMLNNGVIAGDSGVWMYDGGILINSTTGSVLGREIGAVLSNNSCTLVNSGIIAGAIGVSLNAGPMTVTNYGTISGTTASITSLPTSVIAGSFTGSTGVTIHNNGLLQGDVTFGEYGGALTNLFDGNGGTVTGNIIGSTGSDIFDLSHQTVTGTITGGGASDTIAFASGSGAFAIDLGDGTAYGAGEAFTFSGIENETGSPYADTINGDDNANTIAGGAGNDTINGNGGADLINAGPGADTVMAGPGNDVVNGNGGADILYGNGGADVITGGAGADTLTGGAGNDTFVYNLITDSPVAGPDRITDFVHGSDKIDLTALHLPSPGDVTITSSGGVSNVNIDVNNDGTFDMLIQVVGSIALTDIITAPVPAAAQHSLATEVTTSAVHHHLATSLHAVAVHHGLYG